MVSASTNSTIDARNAARTVGQEKVIMGPLYPIPAASAG